MPGVNAPAGDAFFARIAKIERQLAALQNQQLFLVADLEQNMRVRLGPLVDGTGTPNGDFGLSVTDPNGHSTTFLPTYQSAVSTIETTTSTTYTDLTTPGPDLGLTTPAVICGASGTVQLSGSVYMGIPGATGGAPSSATVGVEVNGAAPTGDLDGMLFVSNTVTGPDPIGIATSSSTTVVLEGLTPGAPYTFKMVYKVAGPPTVNFGKRVITAKPL